MFFKTISSSIFSQAHRVLPLLACSLSLVAVTARNVTPMEDLWSLKPFTKPDLAGETNSSRNGIDIFLAREYRGKGLVPLGPADKLTWLRRVTFDLTGLPPKISEQDDFLSDESPDASGKVVDRLLSSEQYGVRYGRHWLDVLRYTDVDENMPAAGTIHLWRDWIISSLNNDLPYDQFVRAQICGNRAKNRTQMTAVGHRIPVPPRAEDVFALGFLSRGATSRANQDQALAISAVETISSAFMGMTVGCAKCHDHFYDPIRQADYYSMKALFDPLVLVPVELATAEERFARGRAQDEYEHKKEELEEPIRHLTEKYRTRLYEERVSMLPPDVQMIIRKDEKLRSAEEQKIADDYYPILRIDSGKIREIMPPDEAKEYSAREKKLNELKAPEALPVFYSVQEDASRAAEKSYVLNTGDPARPKLDQEVHPGFPFAPKKLEFREGRRETFVDWLTAPENPLFARVAVNRLWQWHFGEGLHGNANDFGTLGGPPLHPPLLDWLAAEFIAHDYSMKWLHRLIVSSDTYRRASTAATEQLAANQKVDPNNQFFWRYPMHRLEAEPLRDAMLYLMDGLDLSLGGKSFNGDKSNSRRRTAFMARGFRSSSEVMPDFLTTFDADDGRAVCPRRNETVTAPQALFMMNSRLVNEISVAYGKHLEELSSQMPNSGLIALAFRTALGRPPSPREMEQARAYLRDGGRTAGLAWLMLNLDEFLYLR